MGVAVDHNRSSVLSRLSRANLAGDGWSERMRSTAFALLGLVAATGLGLVAIFSQAGWVDFSTGPVPAPARSATALSSARSLRPAREPSSDAPRQPVAAPARAHHPRHRLDVGTRDAQPGGVAPGAAQPPAAAAPEATAEGESSPAPAPVASQAPGERSSAPAQPESVPVATPEGPSDQPSKPEGATASSTSRPGNSGAAPGHTGAAGRSGSAPGHSGSAPGRSGSSPGHATTPEATTASVQKPQATAPTAPTASSPPPSPATASTPPDKGNGKGHAYGLTK